jgi:hypothetical protein
MRTRESTQAERLGESLGHRGGGEQEKAGPLYGGGTQRRPAWRLIILYQIVLPRRARAHTKGRIFVCQVATFAGVWSGAMGRSEPPTVGLWGNSDPMSEAGGPST